MADLTADENRWCDWQDSLPEYRQAPQLVQTVSTQGFVAGSLRTRAEDAALVRAAGCICRHLWEASQVHPGVYDFNGSYRGQHLEVWVQLIDHDPRCPEALALAIEARSQRRD